jgi:hypothetical protein
MAHMTFEKSFICVHMVIMLQRLQVKNKKNVMAIGMRFKSHKGLKVDKRKKKKMRKKNKFM